MNSKDLSNNGFRVHSELSLSNPALDAIIADLPITIGVYAMVASHIFGRLNGQSDILYIGSATRERKGLKGRVKQYIRPGRTQKTSLRINANLKAGLNEAKVFLWICETPAAKNLESNLLKQYETAHRELPPWNRSLPEPEL